MVIRSLACSHVKRDLNWGDTISSTAHGGPARVCECTVRGKAEFQSCFLFIIPFFQKCHVSRKRSPVVETCPMINFPLQRKKEL